MEVKTVNLCHTYPDGTKALENVNISVAKGECVAIIGANGAGKSTLLQHFNGLLLPTSGEVFIKGERLTKKNLEWARRVVGMVFQNPDDQLFAANVWQDVAYGPRNLKLPEEEVKERVVESLAQVRMQGFENKTINNLSFGEKKRAAIAGVLAMKPEILVLDEPTSELDPKMADEIVEVLLKFKEERRTIIVATHDVDAAPLFADRIYVLNRGRKVLEGKPSEVFAEREIINKSGLRLPIVSQVFELLGKKEPALSIGDVKRIISQDATRD